MPAGASGSGLSMNNTCWLSGEKKGWTQQPSWVSWRSSGAAGGGGVGVAVAAAVGIVVGAGSGVSVEVGWAAMATTVAAGVISDSAGCTAVGVAGWAVELHAASSPASSQIMLN